MSGPLDFEEPFLDQFFSFLFYSLSGDCMLGFIRFLILDCNDVELLKVIYFVRVLLNIVFLIIPIIVIVMLSLDLLKNVISNRDDDMCKW